ncbi:uncharacterized protein HMPREF1541_06531 [Cyphellophora europaea CBS 101466]|uniref:Prion-inhibition and propagation HeLo domain-containing protein n=1 Tax=Cyphellophora europaea (strain CBS 101466) TaxID=1220924 RepID=W2RPQ6_CYPE1|nr:uncharacterized protein HMPREF1541_06531 [Cyphellophora europaea CBS 101466]ETN38496.1 hypothetical protein HMPREF1541_06531 [Cyphellophora europaea CBS 101466]
MSGAELPLAIAGVVLAWKGILDMADVLITLCRDDDQDRSFLHLRVKVARSFFASWGEYHGISEEVERVGNGDGQGEATTLLARCSDSDRELIREVMAAFVRETEGVMERLGRYAGGVGGVKSGSKGGGNADKEAFRKAAREMRLRVKKGFRKVPWNVKDRKAVEEYVEKMESTQKMLRKLTYFEMLPKHVCPQVPLNASGRVAVSHDSNRMPMDGGQAVSASDHICEFCISHDLQSSRKSNASSVTLAAGDSKGLYEVDLISRVADSVRDIDDFHLMDRVQHLALEAHYTDVRHDLCDRLNEFWQMQDSTILKIETAWDPTDGNNDLCAAALYACAEQPKLIYIWDNESKMEAASTQLAKLVYSLLKQCLVGDFAGALTDMSSLQEFDGIRIDIDSEKADSLQAAVEFIELILAHSWKTIGLKSSLLIVLSGLEHLPNEGEYGEVSRALVRAVCSAYEKRLSENQATKVLVLTQGRGRVLQEFDAKWEVKPLDGLGLLPGNLLGALGISVSSSGEKLHHQ